MPELKAFEVWAEEKWTEPSERTRNAWVMAALRAHTKWGEGREVTRDDFDAALEQVLGLKIGGGEPPLSPESAP